MKLKSWLFVLGRCSARARIGRYFTSLTVRTVPYSRRIGCRALIGAAPVRPGGADPLTQRKKVNSRMRQIAILIGAALLIGAAMLTVYVEREAEFQLEPLGGSGKARALVLFHPSRDAHFSDELSMSVAAGFKAAGFSVDRATMTRDTPAAPEGYSLVAVVSNTYWWTPDRPTIQYLGRAKFNGVRTIGLIGGGGATARSQRLLGQALRSAGADVRQTRSFWILRPNDESRMQEPNRAVALQMARQFAVESAQARLAGR